MKRVIFIDKKTKFFVDEEDHDRVSKEKWYKNADGYIVNDKGISLGRFILNYDHRRKVHYRDRDKTNGCKKNLYVRVAKVVRQQRQAERQRLIAP